MKTIPKALLTASIITLALSFTGPGSAIGYGLLKPVGAILFILFFMTNLLAKETPRYDEEQQRHLEDADRAPMPPQREVARPRFATAH
jgi:hypothetical protein